MSSSSSIDVYAKEDEIKKIKKFAAAAGLSASSYLLQCGLKGATPILNQTEIASTLYRMIEKVNSCKMQGCSQESCPVLSDVMDMIKTRFYR